MHFGPWSIIDQAVCKHQPQRPSELFCIVDFALLDPCLDRLDIEWVFDERIVIRCVLFLDGCVEEVAVRMVGYLGKQHHEHLQRLSLGRFVHRGRR